MLAKNQDQVAGEQVTTEGARDVTIQWLVDNKIKGANFAMRRFTIKEGGHTGYHTHDWEHEIFVLSGNGSLRLEHENISLSPGMFAFVDGGSLHQFLNAGAEEFVFLCLIPIRK